MHRYATVSALTAALLTAGLFVPASAFAASTGDVLINEFASQPSSGSDWVEFYNASSSPIDLTGWTLEDLAGNSHTLSGTISAGGFATSSFSNYLNAAGDVIYLLDSSSATLSAVGYGAAATSTVDYDYAPTPGVGESAYRTTDGGSTWATTTSPTEGASNVPVSHADVYVDATSGSDSNSGTADSPLASIAAALSLVSSGGTVHLSGAFSGNVTISSPVTLTASSTGSASLTGMITVNSENVTISGLDITNPSGDFGVLVNHVGNVTVSGNTVHDIGTSVSGADVYGIYFQGSSSLTNTVSGLSFTQNQITNVGTSTDAKSNGAIGIGDSGTKQTVDGAVISNNTISDVYSNPAVYASGGRGAYGILLNTGASSSGSVTNADIENNDIAGLSGSWEHAIGLETNTPNAALTNNVIHDLVTASDEEAVHLEQNAGAASVTFSGNTRDGVALTGGNADVLVDSTVADPAVLITEANTYFEVLDNGSYRYLGLNLFPSIQEGVTAAADGATVNVLAGSEYAGFSVVGRSDITIKGAGIGATVIAPSTPVSTGVMHKYTSNMQASVFVNGSSNVTLEDLTIESGTSTPGTTNGTDAIVFWNASSGALKDCAITGVYTIDGTQSGQGIAVDAGGSQNATLSVENCAISGFQKNGIDAINGNGGSGATGTVSVSVKDGSITGAGPTGVIAQNGIVAWNLGGGTVTASIDGTAISGFDNTSATTPDDYATGLLAYGGGQISSVRNASFSNNPQFNISTTNGSPAVDAALNYWGSASGPDTATLDGSVTYAPWYTDAGLTTLNTGTPSVSGTEASTTVPVAIEQKGTSGTVSITMDMPAGTTITGDASWDGTLEAPAASSTALSFAGLDTTVGSAIEIGSSAGDLTFDRAVKLTFAGQAGKQVGWYDHAGTFTEITDTCAADDQTTEDGALAAGASCKIDSGSDLVVWTKHFSTFVTYSTSPIAPVITPNGSVFHGSVDVTMDYDAGTSIRYTIDGTDPICGGSLGYSSGQVLSFSDSTVLKAIRCETIGASTVASSIASAQFDPAGGGSGGSSGGSSSGGSSSGSGSSGGAVSPTASAPAPSTGGEVLGAATYNFAHDLSYGSTGADVTELQKFLIAEGYDIPLITKSGVAYGFFGPQTKAAVTAFQKANDLPQTGFVGALTRAVLNKGVINTTPETSSSTTSPKTNLTQAQIDALISTLESFGADASTIAQVKASLGE